MICQTYTLSAVERPCTLQLDTGRACRQSRIALSFGYEGCARLLIKACHHDAYCEAASSPKSSRKPSSTMARHRVLVTGANGYVGSHILQQLLASEFARSLPPSSPAD